MKKAPTHTSLPVLLQPVAVVTGAERPVGGVLAVMRAAAVVLLAAVDDLHLDACRRGQYNFSWKLKEDICGRQTRSKLRKRENLQRLVRFLIPVCF